MLSILTNVRLYRYKLNANDSILASDIHNDLPSELVEKYKVDYTAGGAGQNVMRVVASILKRQGIEAEVMFSGCVGKDDYGKQMEERASADGVITKYAYAQDGTPTGTCAVLLTNQGKNRSNCAFLGASQKFSHQHLVDNWKQLVETTDIIYITGFLLPVCTNLFTLLGNHIAQQGDHNKRFALNLSATYVSAAFGTALDETIKFVDIVFGNDDEAIAFSDHKGWSLRDVEEIAKKIALESKVRNTVPRLVVITQGERPVVVAEHKGNGRVETKLFPVEQLSDDKVVDTNGAGDSFCGGFLSQFIQKKNLDQCVKFGNYAAREIIQVSGIVMPKFDNIPN